MASPDTDGALRAQRAALALQLSQGLREERPLADLQAIQARLQLIDGTLGAEPPRPAAWRQQLIALAAVAALVSLVALVPMPSVDFTLEVETGAAQLALAEAGQLGAQRLAGEFRAQGFVRLESADAALQRRAQDEGIDALALRADRLNLRAVRFGAGARLDLQAGMSTLRLAIDGAPHAVSVEFGGAVQTSLGGAPRVTTQVPVVEWLRLVADAQATELWLTRPAQQAWIWRGLRPTALRFVERVQEPDAPVQLQSALRRAVLNLPATSLEWNAPVGSTLELDGLRIERCELGVRDGLTLVVSGTARRVVTATGAHSRSLKPSLLEYVARNHSLGLLWSAAGLLWGISTWMRKQFGGAA